MTALRLLGRQLRRLGHPPLLACALLCIGGASPLAALEGGVPGQGGDGSKLTDVHPSFDLMNLRPAGFNQKIGGMDFLPDGRLVVSTWDGVQTSQDTVWILDNVDQDDPGLITAKQIASGLSEPLGLKVYDGAIYVSEKTQITQLVDTDGDDIIDEYNVFSTGFPVTDNFHNFSFGLEIKNGYMWMALSNCVREFGDACDATDPENVLDRGSLLRISLEPGTGTPGTWEIVATGLRSPNGTGIGVDGELFGGENQGTWLPANQINHYRTDDTAADFNVNFGHVNTIPSTFQHLPPTPPAIYLDHDSIGNSPSQVGLIPGGTIYAGQMVHGDVRHGGVKRDFLEKVGGQYQGVAFRFTQGLEAGINRLVWHDGDLYVGGIGDPGNWNEPGKLFFGLERLRPNGLTTFEMLTVESRSTGFEIEFTSPVGYFEALDPASYEVAQWHYEPTASYGGPRVDEEALAVSAVSISDDYRRVFLEIPGIEAGKVVYVRLHDIYSAEGVYPWSTEAFYTLNQIAATPGPDFVPATGPPPATPRPPDDPGDVRSGLLFAKYEGSWDVLPNFQTEQPVAAGALPNFDISASSGEDDFAYVFTGFIEIDQTEEVTFYTSSDDGSRLWIGNTLVVDNDGLHGPVEQAGSISLAAGRHAITVGHFERGYGELLDVQFSSATIAKQPIPDAALYRPVASTVPSGPYYEAEEGSLQGTCFANAPPGFSGAGYAGCYDGVGAAVQITVDVETQGSYEVTPRYARGVVDAAQLDVYVDGVFAQTVGFPPLGDWNTWGTKTHTLLLGRGFNVIEYRNPSGATDAIYLDRIEVVRSFAGTIDPPTPIPCPTTAFGVDCRQDAAPYLAFPSVDPGGDLSQLPPLLSQTGAFSDVLFMTPSISLVPFEPVAPLWSDGARKYRWISLPTGSQIGWSENGNWSYPAGTVLIKHFELPTDETNPAVTRRLETRALVKTETGWYGATYRWRADYSDADLLTAGLSEDIPVQLAGGGTAMQTWTYPSPSDCGTCHNPFSAGALGLKTGQLNSGFYYGPGKADTQLRTWNHLGFFDPLLDEAALPGYPAFHRIDDEAASPEDRVRSYWDANCSQCHGADPTIPSAWDARYRTPLSAQGVVLAPPVTPGQASYLIDPQNPGNSELFVRSQLRGSRQMPPLGTHLVDAGYLSVLEEWIFALSGEPEGGLRAEYFDEMDLTDPVFTRVDSTIDFDWGSGSPDPSIGVDTFSVRWTGSVTADFSELYTFHATSDDGVRVWLGGQLVIDQWIPQAPTEVTGTIALEAGAAAELVVEYFEAGYGAQATLEWSSTSQPREIVPHAALGQPGTGLTAEYFNGTALASPAMTRVDAGIDFDWGVGSPAPAVDTDHFSVRWTGELVPRYSETYTFHITSDNGRRVWIDGALLIDAWVDDWNVTYEGSIDLNAGQKVAITVEYFENAGGANALLEWSSASQPREVVPQSRTRTGDTAGLWHGSLPGDINTTDPNPRTSISVDLAETEDAIAPDTTEIFSGAIFDADGNLSFSEDIDDRTRLFIDGQLVLSSDQWDDRVSTGNLALAPGWHDFELRISNSTGGSGPHTSPGIGFDPNGGASWQHLADPGDGSLLRTTPAVLPVARLEARHSAKCLDVYVQASQSGIPVHQWDCHADDSQLWKLESAGDGYHRLRVQHSGKCLAVQSGSPANGELVVQSDCSAADSQQWSRNDLGNGYFELRARHSDRCLDVAGGLDDSGALLVQWDCLGGENQQWRQSPADPASSNMGKPAPPGAIVLFDGTDTQQWSSDGAPWSVESGELRVTSGDLESDLPFRDYFLHIEWWAPDNGGLASEQEDGNSGIYHQNRYELQILNSYGKPLTGANDAGAIYLQADATSNAARPPGHWQLYEVTLRAARYDGNGTKLENARITVDWNGVRVQNNHPLPGVTAGSGLIEDNAPGPLRLQDHPNYGEKPRFRNIWIQELKLQ